MSDLLNNIYLPETKKRDLLNSNSYRVIKDAGQDPTILEGYENETEVNQIEFPVFNTQADKDKFEEENANSTASSAKEYLELISKSKYGLCLRGYGSKCHREVELMAFGTVPLITDEVSTDYCFEFKENIHYFKINKPEDIIKIINETPKEKWEEMSNNCKNTFMKYCHSSNAMKSILSIIFEIKY